MLENIQNTQKIIEIHKRRLQKLKVQEALQGRNTPPEVLLEIEDIELAIEELKDQAVDLEESRDDTGKEIQPQRSVQIYLEGDFSSISEDRRSAAVDAFAAVMGISPHSIRVQRVYEGSIIFELTVPFSGIQHLRYRLETNSPQLRLLKVEKIILEIGPETYEEWNREGKEYLLSANGEETLLASGDKAMIGSDIIGTVISDQDTPTFELVRVKLRAGQDVKPGTLIKIPVNRTETTLLIGRVRSAYEHNPNEVPGAISVRDTLGLRPNYPGEEDSTTIYRLIEADLIEEIFEEKNSDGKLEKRIRAPQNLPNSGADVSIANNDEIVMALGLQQDKKQGLHIGWTATGAKTEIILKRESIQRHFFIGGTTGSGKSYAMGVIVEELVKHNLPIVFIDTQDEYSKLAKKLDGTVVKPGQDFTIRISSLTESEMLNLLPTATTELQRDIAAMAFSELQAELVSDNIAKFSIDDLLERMESVGGELTNKQSSIVMAINRTGSLKRNTIFGDGIGKADWRKFMSPCMVINCKGLTSSQLQPIATAVLRELQNLRIRDHIPPYVAVIDEAHLFVPQGEGSTCKQIIREGVRIGRHHGICMVLLTQSPIDIDKSTIRQCNTRMIFALEADQLAAISGVKADATDEMLNALPKMPQGTCLLSGTYESVKHTIPVKIRERSIEDSEGGSTPLIFKEMTEKWLPEIEKLKRKK